MELGLSSAGRARRDPHSPPKLSNQCPGEDSNLHAVSGTRSLVWPVYQFQHLGIRRPRRRPDPFLPASAPERTRTSTGLRPLDPESSASTNSATGAHRHLLALPTSTPGEIRTPDLLIRSQTLYPAELRARVPPNKNRPRGSVNAPRRNRTFNLGIKSPLLCQLSYGRAVRLSERSPGDDAGPPTSERQGERGDLNPRPPEPQSGALTT